MKANQLLLSIICLVLLNSCSKLKFSFLKKDSLTLKENVELNNKTFIPLDLSLSYHNNKSIEQFKIKDQKNLQEDFDSEENSAPFSKALFINNDNRFVRYNWASGKLLSSIPKEAFLKKDKDGNNIPNPQKKEKVIYDVRKIKSAIKEFKKLENINPAKKIEVSSPLEKKQIQYQLGLSHHLSEQPQEALKYYYKSLKQKQHSEIDLKTSSNIVHLLVSQGKGKGKGGEDKEKGKDGDKDDKKQWNEKKDGEDHVDGKKKAQFNEQELTEEMAKQILDSAKQEEGQVLKKKLKGESQKRRKPGRPQGKPW